MEIVIQESLRDQAVALAHEGHQRIIKTKELVRAKVWFPKVNDKIETAVRQCFSSCHKVCCTVYADHSHRVIECALTTRTVS